ncbi:hemin-degrading factor [Dongia sedimenti]|uniref:ChuX/HutX family heme-like substrate-binding protein n=1 Tax=Dongia sedimenti TaxID=3064282 RepID=A0ABU0YGH4_9PROT|nr:ChuX/HutX family heme-like substrate-binding protein [Rhodospirillaceae bacterium R-7]
MPLDEPQIPKSDDLRQRWLDLRQAKPGIRNRDAAEALAVSEAALIASGLSEKTIRLQPDWPGLFARLPKLGKVMALTRNETVVHERRGTYSEASFNDHVGLVLGPDIDLRIFLKSWRFIFAVEEESRRGTLRSLQVFDKSGTAVHKIYAEDGTDAAAWAALIGDLRAPIQSAQLDLSIAPAKAAPRADGEIDAAALLEDWQNLKDTHDFVPLLMKHKAQPNQAFRLAEGRFTARLGTDAVRNLLNTASERAVPIMVFVGNPGIIQIHSGPVMRIQTVGEWLNVLDPEFNLHLREDKVAEVWRVEKPTVDGIVTSVEVFDATGERMATFFGKRKPGEPELEAWRGLVRSLGAAA